MVDGHKIIAKFRGGKFFPGLFMKTGDEPFFRGKAFGYDTFHCGIPVTDVELIIGNDNSIFLKIQDLF